MGTLLKKKKKKIDLVYFIAGNTNTYTPYNTVYTYTATATSWNRLCTVAKACIKHTTEVCEFNVIIKDLYLKIFGNQITLAHSNHKISYHQKT